MTSTSTQIRPGGASGRSGDVAFQNLIDRARAAQEIFARCPQTQVDAAVAAVGWAGYSHADLLARLAVEETGVGNIEDKRAKNRRKISGTMRDLKGAPSVGVIRTDEQRGITEIAKPVGVVAAFTPVTNPGATVVNNMMITLKGANAVILAPHPNAERTCAEAVRLAHAEMATVGVPADLVQWFSLKAADRAESKRRAQALMGAVDLVLVTAGQAAVSAAYSSGTPALGVGVGNVPVIIDATADVNDAAAKIACSKTFDNATSCSSENALVIEDSVYAAVLAALTARGGYVLDAGQARTLAQAMWCNGVLDRGIVGQPARTIIDRCGLDLGGAQPSFLIVEEKGIGADFPFSGEKLSPVLTVYRVNNFEDAVDHVNRILAYQGLGHSCGIHSKTEAHIAELAARAKVCRVLVNQAHCIGNGGDFGNGLKFSLSMSAGTWGRNSTSDNISYENFLNITRLVRPFPAVVPLEDELWGAYLHRDAH